MTYPNQQKEDPVQWLSCEGSGAKQSLLYLNKDDEKHARLAAVLGKQKGKVRA